MPDLRNVTEFIKDVMGYIITFCVLAFVFIFVIAIAPIAGNSMNPTLNDTDMVIVTKFNYMFNDPKRNEIVIFRDNAKKKYVKRIIGLPGENISFINGYLYINGEAHVENLINADTNNFMFEDICPTFNCPGEVIPEDYYLVLGDNRSESQDSRDPMIGLVSKKQIIGKVVLKIWPFSEISSIK